MLVGKIYSGSFTRSKSNNNFSSSIKSVSPSFCSNQPQLPTPKFYSELKFSEEDFDRTLNGEKTLTVREGIRVTPETIPVISENLGRKLSITRTGLELLEFGKLNLEHAKAEGFKAVQELRTDLLKYYPHLNEDNIVTIIRFVVKR